MTTFETSTLSAQSSPFSVGSSPVRGYSSRNALNRHVSELHLEQREGDSTASPPSRNRSQAKLPRSREASFHSRLFSAHGGSPSATCPSIDASASPSEASDDGMLVLKTARTRNRNRDSQQRQQQQKKTRRSTLAASGAENNQVPKGDPLQRRGSLQLSVGPLSENNGNFERQRQSDKMSAGGMQEAPAQSATPAATSEAADMPVPAPRPPPANDDGIQLHFSPESTQEGFSPTQIAKQQDDIQVETSLQPSEDAVRSSSLLSPSRRSPEEHPNRIDLTDSPDLPSHPENLSAHRRAPLSPSASPRNSILGGPSSARRGSSHRRAPSASAAATMEKSASSHSMTPNRSQGSSAPDSGIAQVTSGDTAELRQPIPRQRGQVVVRDFAFSADDDRYHGRGRVPSMAMTSSSIENDDGTGPSSSGGFIKGVFGGHGRRKSSFGAWGGFSLGGFAWGRNKGQEADRSATSSPDVVIPSISDLTPSSSVEPQGYLSPSIAAQRDSAVEESDDGDDSLPEGNYRVIYPFESEGAHEMSVKEGEVVRVKGRLGDGWVVAERLDEADTEEGLVPESYLQPADDSLDASDS